MIDLVVFDNVVKQFRKVPTFIVRKLSNEATDVETCGINEVRKIPGYLDEPLKGDRKGQRSIRLSIRYRAIYIEKQNGEINMVSVEEVSKHVF